MAIQNEPNEAAFKYESGKKTRYMSNSSEPYETAINNEGGKFRYVKSAHAAPESGQKKMFSPKDMKIRKIKMSFSTRLIPRFFLIV